MATELPSVLRARSGRSWVGALVLFLLSAMGWPSVALGNGADDVVREMVSGRVDAIRQRLQQEHDSEDYGLLLRTKEMVDAVLLPAFLLGELGSDRQWEVCRILGHDFRYEDVRAHLSGSAALEQALSPYGLGAGREVRFSGVVECFACEGAGYPVALAMDGAVGRERGWIHVAWHEPYMANSYLFWPLYPAGSILEWDAEGAHYTSLAEEGGQPVAVSFGEGPPLFNNPGCVYNPLGALVAQSWLLRRASAPALTTDARSESAGDPTLTFIDGAGNVVQQVRFGLADGAVRRISVTQNPTRLLHHSPNVYKIEEVVGDEVVRKGTFRPSALLDYLADGRQVVFEFGRDAGGPSVPMTMAVTRNGRTTVRASFASVSYSASPLPVTAPSAAPPALLEAFARLRTVYAAIDSRENGWTPQYYHAPDLRDAADRHVLRARLKYNAYAAIKAHDATHLQDALARYRKIVEEDEVGPAKYIYSVEALAHMAFRYVDDDAAWMVVDGPLRSAYGGLSADGVRSHGRRLAEQGRFGFGLILADSLSGRLEGDERGAEVVAQLRAKLLAACEDGRHPMPNGLWVNAERTAHLNRAVAARMSGVSPDPGGQEQR
jgi:hypothetical protein